MVWYFAAVSFIALCAIPLWLFKFGAASDFWVTVALAAITAGVIGNLFDRLGLPGLDWGILYEQREGEAVYAVRDWILFQINDQWRWPNFNLADSYLVCGAAVAMLRTLWVPDSSTNSAG
jgi:signal peptidase II